MINLCLVVIATQFSETKKREMERMRQERARFTSSSTLASSTNNSEPTTCYAEIVKYIAHLYRRLKRRLIKKLRLYKYAFDNRLCCCFDYDALDLLIRIFHFFTLIPKKWDYRGKEVIIWASSFSPWRFFKSSSVQDWKLLMGDKNVSIFFFHTKI